MTDAIEPRLATAIRTLIASGYAITGTDYHPTYVEVACERIDAFDALVQYLIALTDRESLRPVDIEDIQQAAATDNRTAVIVTAARGDSSIGWHDFLDALGGPVPHWRTFAPSYEPALRTAAQNRLPENMTGEAWLAFEQLVADGFEFVFGRLVKRLGGHRRGLRVSDMVAQTPDERVWVIDAKASEQGFDTTWDALRALREYVERQVARQRGNPQLVGAILVSSDFRQSPAALARIADDFLTETRIPLTMLDAGVLADMVTRFRERPQLRSAVRWNYILRSGRVTTKQFEQEFNAAADERLAKH